MFRSAKNYESYLLQKYDNTMCRPLPGPTQAAVQCIIWSPSRSRGQEVILATCVIYCHCCRPLSFKTWNGPAIQVQALNELDSDKFILAVNMATRWSSKFVWLPLRLSQASAWAEHPSTVQLVGVLQLDVSEWCPILYTFEGVIHSVESASGQNS
jgi:hypothetical protein